MVVTLWFLLKKQTEGVRVIGSFDLAAFMSRSFNCPSETRSRNAITRVTSFLSVVLIARLISIEVRHTFGLPQRAMPPKPTEGSRIRPIASTYNVMITLVYPVYPFWFGSLTVAPPTRKGINMKISLPFGSENLWRKSGFKFPETTRLYSQRE